MSTLLYTLKNNKIQINLLKNNKNIGKISSTLFTNTLFINELYVNEDYRLKNYGTYLINSNEIILRNYYFNIKVIKLIAKDYEYGYLHNFFEKLGYNKYDFLYTNYISNSSYRLTPMYKNID
jgi:GNAT superfamily N-acetyltransferase